MPKIKNIQSHIFQLLSILTIGFPFVGYKILGGILIHNLHSSFIATIIALVFVVWGLVDLVFNTISLHALMCRGHVLYPVCLLSVVGRKHPVLCKWKDSGEALDLMLSFCIVAIVVGGNLFEYLDGAQIKVWNICTVVNVLGAGIARLGATITNNHNP